MHTSRLLVLFFFRTAARDRLCLSTKHLAFSVPFPRLMFQSLIMNRGLRVNEPPSFQRKMASANEKIPAAPPRPNGLLAYGMESRDRLWNGIPRNTPILLIYPRLACTLLARSEKKQNPPCNRVVNLYTAWMRKHVSAYLDTRLTRLLSSSPSHNGKSL